LQDNSSGNLSPRIRQIEQDDPVGNLQVTVKNGAIVVTMPGTRYSVTYCKDGDLWLRAIEIRHDPDYPSHELTFRVRAWTAANAKARWLGWIA
jgi:hypothetical protein